ncbi:iron hydrogenase [Panaeolus papilionaceus]|nr:iron hydrogenase [Panaeolus papilionaceus]
MTFSGALTLTDLNDFIAPSQACIKPVEQTNAPTQQVKQLGDASTEIMIDSSGAYYEVSPDQLTSKPMSTASRQNEPRQLAQAQISLNDCLACSGCITSAESVLITLQSHTEVLNFLKENGSLSSDSRPDHEPTSPSSISSSPSSSTSSSPSSPRPFRTPVVSIAPQSLASLATAVSASRSKDVSCIESGNVTPLQVFCGLRVFFTEILGFARVYDTTFARHVALKEHVKEFEERKNQSRKQDTVDQARGEAIGGLPMLASACPGWICYAEKAHKEMLPFISRTKSPQQVMGTIVKEYLGRKWGKSPDQIYHVTVMPCYDKKLEASRQDFYNEIYATRDVDCVITTGELEILLRECGWDLSQIADKGHEAGRKAHESGSEKLKDDGVGNKSLTMSGSTIPEMMQHAGTSSGSYLHSIISHIRAESQVPLVLEIKAIRNADYEEFTLYEEDNGNERGSGKVVFKGAKCYGFRNLQNIVRKVGREKGVRTGGRIGVGRRLKKGNTENGEGEEKGYDYVEVMACPGGCVNGGGQIKPIVDEEKHNRNWEDSGVHVDTQMQGWKWGDRDWVRRVEESYWNVGTDARHVDDDEGLTKNIMEAGLSLRTSYRAVESEVIGLAVKW